MESDQGVDMKKILALILLALMPVLSFSQNQIYYNSSPTLQWDYDYLDANGDPLLEDDIVDFEIFIWDETNGFITAQQIESLTPFTVTTNPEAVLTFPYRTTWSVAVRSRVTDGGGNIEYSDFAYTTIQEDVQDSPFVYAPNLTESLPKPTDLRDSGI